jgi:phosphoglycolate phosphatase-like HAD superfamily hydrolase
LERNLIDALITNDDVPRGRPYPDMIFEAMRLTGVTEATQVMKIGDSVIDIEEGKSANCGITAGITTGAQTRTQLEKGNPDFILDSLREVLQVIVSA